MKRCLGHTAPEHEPGCRCLSVPFDFRSMAFAVFLEVFGSLRNPLLLLLF